MTDQDIEIFNLSFGIVVRGRNNQQGVVRLGDGLYNLCATGEERIGNTRDEQADGFGAFPSERTRSLVWSVAQRFNDTAHMRQRFRIDVLPAIDDARDSCGADPSFSGDIIER